MNVNSNSSRDPAARLGEPRQAAARGFIFLAQLLVLVALVIGFNLQAGLHPLTATAIAGSVLLVLMGINRILTRRSQARALIGDTGTDTGAAEWPDDYNQTQAAVMPYSYVPVEMSEPAAPLDFAAPLRIDHNEAQRAEAQRFDAKRIEVADALAAAVSASQSVEFAQASALPPPMPRYTEPKANQAPPGTPQPTLQAAYPPAHQALRPPNPALTAYPSPNPAQDYWAHRPAQSRFDQHAGHYEPVLGAPAQPPAMPAMPAVSEAPAAGLRETDVEAIQSLIKKLADEVNLAEQARDDSLAAIATAVAQTPPPSASANCLALEPPTLAEPELPSALSSGIANSLDALRVTAQTMRQPSHLVFGHELPPPLPMPAAPALTEKGVALAEAIAADRADVLLEPILGLRSQEAQHFEVSLRLRAPDGAALDFTPSDETLRGTGLLPLFDAAKIARTSTVARNLAERGKTGAVFSSYSGEALSDRAFAAAGASVAAGQRVTTLVLTFSQADARGFEAPEWASIADMRALGFRFALSGVTDLDMNLEGLVQAGFEFVKLDASVFITGLRSPAGLIPASDVCRYLAGLGLALIVEHIDDEEQFSRAATYGALFGQGQLFGGPRVLKAEASARGSQAA